MAMAWCEWPQHRGELQPEVSYKACFPVECEEVFGHYICKGCLERLVAPPLARVTYSRHGRSERWRPVRRFFRTG